MPGQDERDRYSLPPEIEAERLRSLEKLGLLHTPPEDRFGYITQMARTALGVPMSAINFIDRDRQSCFDFSADHVLDFNVPREQSVCRATIARSYSEPEDLALIYEDLAESEFAELPAVTAEGGVRFYAGFPLFGPGGQPVGTFCIYDSQPRRLTLAQRATFAELAAWAQREMESSDHLHAVETTQTLLRATVDSLLDPQMMLEAVRDPAGRVVDFIYREANSAACKDMATPRDELIGRRVLELLPGFAESGLLSYYAQCLETGQPGTLDDYPFDHDVQEHSLRYDIRIAPAGNDHISLTFRDVTDRFQAAQREQAAKTLLQASAESMFDPQALLEAVRDPEGRVVDFRYLNVNRATCTYLGLAESDLVGHTQLEDTPNMEGSELHRRYVQCLQDGQPVILDNYAFFNEILDDGRRYDIRATRAGADLLSLTWRDVTDRFQAEQLLAESRELQRKAAARYRDLMMNSIVPAALVGPDGRYALVNPAMCAFLGYDEATLLGMTPADVTAPEDVEAGARGLADLLAGRTSSYRAVKQYLHADGHRLWGELSLSCIRSTDGQLENLAVQVLDITEQVRAQQRNAALTKQLTDEMASAAQYVQSILPDDLHGEVEGTSSYLPALDLGGDVFHFRWLDDDHLKVYLIDVSGHGIRPALLSASVHNLIRTESLPMPVLLHPDRVLNKLNTLFPMEDQGDTYFTIWYGIYQVSTRTLRYASAGHPPSLALNRDGDAITAIPLASPSTPIGMFRDTTYTTASYTMPADGQLLIYSDGAFEIKDDPDGRYLLSNEDFIHLCATLAARSDWSLDTLIDELKALSPRSEFDDDCSLVLLTFPSNERVPRGSKNSTSA